MKLELSKIHRQIIFFVIAFCLYYLSVTSQNNLVNIHPILGNVFILSLVYTGILVGTYYLARLNMCSENFWDVSQYAKCKGGPYMWQGDSPEAKMCRELASTEQGRCGISSYNCPSGYIGTPKLPFYYSPLSNDQWKNERCENREKCGCVDTGLCGMEKQVE
jgi:hypothetical protein